MARWLAIGCIVTLAVLAMAFVALGWVVLAGVFER